MFALLPGICGPDGCRLGPRDGFIPSREKSKRHLLYFEGNQNSECYFAESRRDGMISTTLYDVMTQGYLYVEEQQPTGKALNVMRDMKISCVYVMRDNVVTGIISERTILAKSLEGQNLADLPAGEVMSRPLLTLTPEHSVIEASEYMKLNKVRHLGVIDDNGDLRGTVTPVNIVNILKTDSLTSSLSVGKIMAPPPVLLPLNATLLDGARAIVEADGCCAVVMDGKYAVGVISEKDIALCIGYGEDISTTKVEASMSKRVIGIDETDTIGDAILTMRRHHIHRVMVFDENIKITGLLALSGLVHNIKEIIHNPER